ncbi:hypothetical protein F5J12DRAFT_891366 [Pisolithus orientalis]|uniref:uncharacterized protein n=1 Tax=Pisolithus orientalis TaxID=936130 RepID=UPI002224AF6A|nr:uncharacterized protein F5J12DRAFT_891366 [Pisolithus orientalis]KAI6010863.1 hypothetical protein F5J12DRAFT_891366 [Pisolithus orientalis]
MEQVGECTYVISANGYKTQDQDGLLVGSIDGEAQKWRIEYAERHDAYTIAKENDRGVGWVAPTDDERQIRVWVLIVGPSDPPFYPSDELFRFKYSD